MTNFADFWLFSLRIALALSPAIHKKIAGKMLVARRRACLVVSFHANPPVPAVKTKFVCLSL